eukprot:COSAG04_NODE_29612_length_268_cov_0.573964_1_plen_57_part_01
MPQWEELSSALARKYGEGLNPESTIEEMEAQDAARAVMDVAPKRTPSEDDGGDPEQD